MIVLLVWILVPIINLTATNVKTLMLKLEMYVYHVPSLAKTVQDLKQLVIVTK